MGSLRGVVRVVVVLGLACAGVGPASAAGKWTLGGALGAAIPSGDFGVVMQGGFEGAVHADYWATEMFAIGFDLGGSGHDAKDEVNDAINNFTEALLIADGATTVASNLGYSASIFRFGLRATLALPTGGPASPFVQLGGGIYRLNAKIDGDVTADGVTASVHESDDDTRGGVNAAAGMLFRVAPKVSLGGFGQIHNVFTEDESTQYFGFGAIVSVEVGGPS